VIRDTVSAAIAAQHACSAAAAPTAVATLTPARVPTRSGSAAESPMPMLCTSSAMTSSDTRACMMPASPMRCRVRSRSRPRGRGTKFSRMIRATAVPASSGISAATKKALRMPKMGTNTAPSAGPDMVPM
jgi:hypothetical protein